MATPESVAPQPPRYLWFRVLVVLGILLGILLLTQALRNYIYVSERLVRDQARRDAEHLTTEIERGIREQRPADAEAFRDVLEDVHDDHTSTVAWLRLLDLSEGTLAQVGKPTGASFTADRLRNILTERDGATSEVRETPEGEVLVFVARLRILPPPGRRGGPPREGRGDAPPPGPMRDGRGDGPPPNFRGNEGPNQPPRRGGGRFPGGGRFLEVGMNLNLETPALGQLRRNLILSSSAAIALLVSMTVLGLRFGGYIRGKQLEEQLALARRVQQDLLPPMDPSAPSVDFAAQCVPAWQVGGDFFDFFDAGDGRIALVLGDVSGKGLPAALLMGLLHGGVRMSRWTESAPAHEEASRQLNHLLCTRTSSERYASMFWSYYDPGSHRLRYVNAGHLPPMVVGRHEDGKLEVQRLDVGGPVMGLLENVPFRQGDIAIRPGDLLVLYSDGIAEALNAADEEFGEERVLAVVKQNWERTAGEIRDAILIEVREFLGKLAAHDDQTLVVARLRTVEGDLTWDASELAESRPGVLVTR